eukprot:6066557-Alexandrium_andersonii.AAC.1
MPGHLFELLVVGLQAGRRRTPGPTGPREARAVEGEPGPTRRWRLLRSAFCLWPPPPFPRGK